MKKVPLPRIDKDDILREKLTKYCRLKKGEIWEDPLGKHRIGCLDACNQFDISKLMGNNKSSLAIHDPPYNLAAFARLSNEEYINWSEQWINTTESFLQNNSSLYIWVGGEFDNHLEPFASFLLMMKKSNFSLKNYITMRNQRGYGTQKNWMSIRQELLYYIKGNPVFNIEHVYTDIPKAVRGFYKLVEGKITENFERSKSEFIRAGNVWIDIQQVFFRMEENVNGCFAQKPLKAYNRIINVSSSINDILIDFFLHSGTTLISAELLNRRCFAIDIEPVYCEISIRRLEHFRKTGKIGWQNSNPFETEIKNDLDLKNYLVNKYNYNFIF